MKTQQEQDFDKEIEYQSEITRWQVIAFIQWILLAIIVLILISLI